MPTELDIETETQRVYENRLRNFLRLGFTVEESGMLAATDVDWHPVEVLIQKGCPIYTALNIVS